MRLESLNGLTEDAWWSLQWPNADACWRAWRSSLGFVVLESPAVLTNPDELSCLRALQLGLTAPWRLPARLVMRDQALHLQVAWDEQADEPADDLPAALLEDLQTTQTLLLDWTQEEPQAEPSEDEEPIPEPQALEAISRVFDLLEQDPDLGPLSELDEDTGELTIGVEDDDWLVFMRPLPTRPGAQQVAVMMPQELLPAQAPELHASLQQHLQGNDALQLGPQVHWVVDAGGQQLFLQALLDPEAATIEALRLLLARMLALETELSGEEVSVPSPALDPLQLHLSGLRA
jgi:hypothetical protein